MNNFLVAIGVFLIVVLGALFAVPAFVDWNGYRGVFEEEASRVLGREVRVGGAVNLRLLPSPYFRFEKVRIADAPGVAGQPFIRADSLTVWLAVPPLLRGVVEANDIEIEKPVVNIGFDKSGAGNWQSLGQGSTASIYLPRDISLQSLKLRQATVTLRGSDGGQGLRLEDLNGELSAPALEGPYKFRGTFGAGQQNEIRFATAKPEPDGAVRFKGSVRIDAAGPTYALDGRLVDPMGTPRIDGELTATIPVSAPGASAAAGVAVPVDTPAFEFKAALDGHAGGATLQNIALTFEQGGRPQLLSGGARVDWRSRLAINADLTSRWLDLNRVLGLREGDRPLDALLAFAGRLGGALPADATTTATIAVDQANLGSDSISGLRLGVTKSADRLAITELSAGLPGGTQVEIKGRESAGTGVGLSGDLTLRGLSFARLTAWIMARPVSGDARADGAFAARGLLRADDGEVSIRDLVGELAGTQIAGSASYRWKGRPEIAVALRGPQLDLRSVLSDEPTLPGLLALLPAAGGGGEGPDLTLQVSAGRLLTPARTYDRVSAGLELKQNTLRVGDLRFSSDSGYTVEAAGELRDIASAPRGTVTWTAAARSAAALADLSSLLDVPPPLAPSETRAAVLAPLRLAGSATFGAEPGLVTLAAAGETAVGRTTVNARLAGGFKTWRTSPADVTVGIDAPDTRIAAAFLAGTARPAAAQPGDARGPARLRLKAAGVPATALSVLAQFESADLALTLRGDGALAAGGTSFAGIVDVKSADTDSRAGLLAVVPGKLAGSGRIDGSARLTVAGGATRFEQISAGVGDDRVTGAVTVKPDGDRYRIEADLATQDLALTALLGPLLDRRFVDVGAVAAAVSGRDSLWSDVPFGFAALSGLSGDIRLQVAHAAVAPRLALQDARFDIAFDGTMAQVKSFSGSGLGGRWTGTLRLDKAAAGVRVSGSVKLSDGALAVLAGPSNGEPRASGPLSGTLEFSGQGLNPRGLVAALQGKGAVEIGAAEVAHLSPRAVRSAVDAAVAADADAAVRTLRDTIASAFASNTVALGPRTVALEIGDGFLRSKTMAIAAPDGNATGQASLDLQNFRFATDWKIEAKPAASRSGAAPAALPLVTVGLSAPVGSLASAEPTIGIDALERELSVRRMERDVEVLERLRQQDEARARREAERRAAEQRQKAAEPEPPVIIVPPIPAPALPQRPADRRS